MGIGLADWILTCHWLVDSYSGYSQIAGPADCQAVVGAGWVLVFWGCSRPSRAVEGHWRWVGAVPAAAGAEQRSAGACVGGGVVPG